MYIYVWSHYATILGSAHTDYSIITFAMFVFQGGPGCFGYIVQCIQVHGSLLHCRVHICCHPVHGKWSMV